MKSSYDRVLYPGILLVFILSIALPKVAFAGADVQNGVECALNPLDSGLPGPDPVITTDTHSVVTPSGNSVLVCKYTGLTDMIYESAYQNAGFLCGTFAGTTYHSKVVITPSGKAIFTCHVHPGKKSSPPTEESTAASESPPTAPPDSSHGNGNGNSAQQGSEEDSVSAEEPATTPQDNPGPGNSDNHGNGQGNGNSSGGGNGNGNGNGNGGGNGNGNGNGGGNGNGKKDG